MPKTSVRSKRSAIITDFVAVVTCINAIYLGVQISLDIGLHTGRQNIGLNASRIISIERGWNRWARQHCPSVKRFLGCLLAQQTGRRTGSARAWRLELLMEWNPGEDEKWIRDKGAYLHSDRSRIPWRWTCVYLSVCLFLSWAVDVVCRVQSFHWPVSRQVEYEEQVEIQVFNYYKYLSNRSAWLATV